MVEIRFHGRGGQGAVVASHILAAALFHEGKFTQCFSSFGGERRGSPVVAFVRVDEERIRRKCEITTPNHVIVLDPTLLDLVDVAKGLAPDGLILINSDRGPDEFAWGPPQTVAAVDASDIAKRHHLGKIVNTAILGAYARVSRLVGLDAVAATVRTAAPARKDDNEAATREAYEQVRWFPAEAA